MMMEQELTKHGARIIASVTRHEEGEEDVVSGRSSSNSSRSNISIRSGSRNSAAVLDVETNGTGRDAAVDPLASPRPVTPNDVSNNESQNTNLFNFMKI